MKVIGFPFVRIFGHFLQFVFLNFSCCTLDARTKNFPYQTTQDHFVNKLTFTNKVYVDIL